MNSSMPSVGASTREERWAAGGPGCSWWAIVAASMCRFWLLGWAREVTGVPGAPPSAVLGHDGDEQVAALLTRLGGRLLLELDEQRVARRGAVGDRERDVEGEPLRVDVGDDVLDRQPRGLTHALDQVAPEPARAGRRVGR